MNGIREIQAPGVAAADDPRFRRVKTIAVEYAMLAGLLQMDGSLAIKIDGFPEGGQILATKGDTAVTLDGKKVSRLILMVHHPDFPMLLAGMPVPAIDLAVEVFPVPPDATADDSQKGEPDYGR